MTVVLAIRISETPLLFAMVLAFVGGLLSFVSPCCAPLLPGYLGFLGRTAVDPDKPPTRRMMFAHGLAFVLGFTTVFTIAGIAIVQVLRSVSSAQGYVRLVGGVLIILLGLHTTRLIQIPALHRTWRLTPRLPTARGGMGRLGIIATPVPAPAAAGCDAAPAMAQPSAGNWRAFGRSYVIGIFFAAGWTPCVGPILAGIYGVVAAQAANGGVLLAAYSLGLGVPFLLMALWFSRISRLMRRLNRYYNAISLASGLFLILIGILILTDTMTRLARYAPPLTIPGVNG